MCAAISQSLQGTPDAFTVSFLCVGCTSVIHHCRLDEWWKYDTWRLLDHLAVVAFGVIACLKFRARPHWLAFVGAVCVLVFALIHSSVLSLMQICVLHSLMHYVVALSMLYLNLPRSVPKGSFDIATYVVGQLVARLACDHPSGAAMAHALSSRARAASSVAASTNSR